MGTIVKGYSLSPEHKTSLFEEAKISYLIESEIGDIRDFENLENSINKFEPEIVFHFAAQTIVRESYKNPVDNYSTNLMGTVNLLESWRRSSSVKSIIIITSDKCYENLETDRAYLETDPMGGYDPYSSSKGCCELIVSSTQGLFLILKILRL